MQPITDKLLDQLQDEMREMARGLRSRDKAPEAASAGLSVEEIDAAEREMKRVRAHLCELGRALYKMRNGRALGAEYAFDSYSRQTYKGAHYYKQEGPDWGVGTPIICLSYYWARGEDCANVTLPERYLACDWQAEEQARLENEAAKAAEQNRVVDALRSAQREASEKAEFERLKAMLGEKARVRAALDKLNT